MSGSQKTIDQAQRIRRGKKKKYEVRRYRISQANKSCVLHFISFMKLFPFKPQKPHSRNLQAETSDYKYFLA